MDRDVLFLFALWKWSLNADRGEFFLSLKIGYLRATEPPQFRELRMSSATEF